jgi:hypothetical protein
MRQAAIDCYEGGKDRELHVSSWAPPGRIQSHHPAAAESGLRTSLAPRRDPVMGSMRMVSASPQVRALLSGAFGYSVRTDSVYPSALSSAALSGEVKKGS